MGNYRQISDPAAVLAAKREHAAGRKFAVVEFDRPDPDDYETDPGPIFIDDIDEANVITSMTQPEAVVNNLFMGPASSRHKPVIDFDIPVRLVPSSTPGHHHLYIDKEITWDAYRVLLMALSDAGLVEPGYVASSLARGFSAVRPPWITKD